MRKDPRPVNDRDLFEDRNALTGDGPEGKLLGPTHSVPAPALAGLVQLLFA